MPSSCAMQEGSTSLGITTTAAVLCGDLCLHDKNHVKKAPVFDPETRIHECEAVKSIVGSKAVEHTTVSARIARSVTRSISSKSNNCCSLEISDSTEGLSASWPKVYFFRPCEAAVGQLNSESLYRVVLMRLPRGAAPPPSIACLRGHW